MKSTLKTKKMVECALLVAVGTVLSLFSVVQMPYGGSVTVASMLPVILISYRHGLGWGLGSGVVYAVIQQLLGLSNLSYFTTWQSIVAVILLDYMIAFVVTGLGGIFRRVIKRQSLALVYGSLLVCVIRYFCHVISGATVWAGLSIPTEAALIYSFGYNATYMVPETVVLVLVAYYIGSVLDFRRDQPVRLPAVNSGSKTADLLAALAGLLTVCALAIDTVLVFSHLQNADGEFDMTGLAVERFAGSFWMGVVIVSAVAAVAITGLFIGRRHLLGQQQNDHNCKID
ncbi:MAG: energy-coupled thiamine transporter ThiT [Clostridia bacterium]|nr:energy-coupled thiamine transporter ThiT [Clostridia bacterium]